FFVGEGDADRMASLYVPGPDGRATLLDMRGSALPRATMLSRGGGPGSRGADYHRFTQMLLRGGELDGVRLLSPRTVELMTSNHLPGHTDLEAFGRPLFAEMPFHGFGFGLG